MSRTEPKDPLNLSSSTLSLSEASEVSEVDEDGPDIKIDIEKILSEETKNYEILDQLPPTPQRPTTRSQVRGSVSPAVSTSTFVSIPQKGRRNKDSRGANVSPAKSFSSVTSSVSVGSINRQRSNRNKRTEKDICKDFGIDVEDSELQDIEKDDDEDRVHVDNMIDDLLDLGLGKKKAPGKFKHSTLEEEKLDRQIHKLRTKVPLEINGDGRCAVLQEDVSTVRNTLEKINVLVSVLEKTRDKLVNEDKSLVYTAPPVRIQKKPNLPRGGVIS